MADQILFLKSAYLPLPLEGGYDTRTETLTMKADQSKRVEAVIEALLQRNTNSKRLLEYFIQGAGRQESRLVIDYTAEDDELLRTCLSGN